MKKIYSLICMATLALSFVACSDDDEVGAEYNRPSTISVVKSDVVFSASAGTGNVVVRAQGPVSFSTASEWCKATAQNDSTVEVTVDNNESNVGRSSQLTIKSGVDSVNVTIQQQGFYMQTDMGTVVSYGNVAKRAAYVMNTTGSPEISTTEDWIQASIKEDSLIVNVDANETGHLRQGYVKYTFGEFKDSVLVSQYDFATDLAGSYYLAFTDGQTGKLSYILAQLGTDEEGSVVLNLPSFDFTIPVIFNKSTCQLSIASGQYIGDYEYNSTVYKVATILGNKTKGYITYSTAVTYTSSFQYDEENGTYAMFENDGSWTSYPVEYLAFYAFKDTPFNTANRFGSLMTLVDPYLLKVDATGARKNMSMSAPKLSIMK